MFTIGFASLHLWTRKCNQYLILPHVPATDTNVHEAMPPTRTEANTLPNGTESSSSPTKYVYQRTIAHGLDPDDPNKRLYCIIWHGFTANEDTWEPPNNIPHNAVARYCKRHKLEMPKQNNTAVTALNN